MSKNKKALKLKKGILAPVEGYDEEIVVQKNGVIRIRNRYNIRPKKK
jgi:hypothetical protein